MPRTCLSDSHIFGGNGDRRKLVVTTQALASCICRRYGEILVFRSPQSREWREPLRDMVAENPGSSAPAWFVGHSQHPNWFSPMKQPDAIGKRDTNCTLRGRAAMGNIWEEQTGKHSINCKRKKTIIWHCSFLPKRSVCLTWALKKT